MICHMCCVVLCCAVLCCAVLCWGFFVLFCCENSFYLLFEDAVGLKDVKEVKKLQETAQSELQEFVKRNQPHNHTRFARILLRLPAIKTVSSKRVEGMFFSPLIGEVKIDHIMPSILNNTNDVSSMNALPET